MLDIQLLRNNLDAVAERLATRGKPFDFSGFQNLEAERKTLQTKTQELQAQRNTLSKQIGMLKGKGEDASGVMAEVANLNRHGDIYHNRMQQQRKCANRSTEREPTTKWKGFRVSYVVWNMLLSGK